MSALTVLLCIDAVIWCLVAVLCIIEKLTLAPLRNRLLKAQIEQLEWDARVKSREWSR